MGKIILSCVLFLGVIPCDSNALTLYKNPELGEKFVFILQIIVCAIVIRNLFPNLKSKRKYENIVAGIVILFLAQILLNAVGAIASEETYVLSNRTMSLLCLGAYYLYGIYMFQDANSLVKAINGTLLTMIVLSFILYYTNYEDATYIENATTRYFKGISLNRNSYVEISLFYIATNIYLWMQTKKYSLYFILTTGLAIYTTYLTHSATAMICVALFIALSLIYYLTQRTPPFKTVLIIYLLFFIYMILLQSENVLFLKQLTEYFDKDITLTGRTEIWDKALDLIFEHPIFGRGFDSIVLYRMRIWENDPHNGILYILLTQGLFGMILLFSVFMIIMTRVQKIIKKNKLCTFMNLFVIVWLVRGLAESVFAYTHYVFWVALIIMEMSMFEENQKAEKSELTEYNDITIEEVDV